MSRLADGAVTDGHPLLAIIYDLKYWMRQLAIYETDYWKHTCHVRGGFRQDVRLQMGRGSAYQSTQRLRIILVKMITNKAVEEGWGCSDAY